MAEYIEREAVCSDCKNQKVCVDKSVCPVGRAPAADVEAVKHGRWFEMVDSKLDTHTGEYWEEVYYNCVIDWKSPYCPNCGAKMKED